MDGAVVHALLLMFLIAHCRAQYKDLPGCNKEALEACGTDFVLFANTTHLAEDGDKIKESCKLHLKQLECADEFCSRCLLGFSRAAALLGVRSAYDFFEEKCTESSELHRQYLRVVSCLNKAGPEIHREVTDVRLRLYTITKTISGRDKVDYACCTYYDFHKMTADAIDSHCADPEARNFYLTLMERSFGELLGLACGEYTQGSLACKKLGKVTPLEGLKSEDARSFVGPMIDIIHSLGLGSG
ncbi:uncharacterized protein LOC135398246 isoform X2 [Ornithodoros turicata]|uniref:uncharacterized protein LOC135398246 isoform X2 n=1 Tax=Ornithodoros turicata TaxID=34597 RepID=UPI003138A27F